MFAVCYWQYAAIQIQQGINIRIPCEWFWLIVSCWHHCFVTFNECLTCGNVFQNPCETGKHLWTSAEDVKYTGTNNSSAHKSSLTPAQDRKGKGQLFFEVCSVCFSNSHLPAASCDELIKPCWGGIRRKFNLIKWVFFGAHCSRSPDPENHIVVHICSFFHRTKHAKAVVTCYEDKGLINLVRKFVDAFFNTVQKKRSENSVKLLPKTWCEDIYLENKTKIDTELSSLELSDRQKLIRRIFGPSAWLKKRKITIDLSEVSPEEFTPILRRYYGELKTSDGKTPAPATMNCLRAGILIWAVAKCLFRVLLVH